MIDDNKQLNNKLILESMINISNKYKNPISLLKIIIEIYWIKLHKCNKEIIKKLRSRVHK